MKYLTIAVFTLLLTSCSVFDKVYKPNNTLSYKDNNGNKQLTGIMVEEDFQKFEYKDWYNTAYDAYQPLALEQLLSDKKKIKELFKGVYFEVYLGTWCSDSKREVPQFMKTMNTWGIESSKIKLIALNQDKKGFRGEEIGKRITHVPTIIIYKKDALIDVNPTEINRIIETPNNTIETDIITILKGEEPYVPHLEL